MSEIVYVMPADEARTRLERVRELVIAAWDDVKELYRGRAWHALGYASWEELCDTELDGAQIRVPRDERREIVANFKSSGMSNYAIADVLGISEGTVRNDISTTQDYAVGQPVEILGKDGKVRTYDPPAPKPHVVNNSGMNEWYTPPQFIRSARAVMGGIDLDPASSHIAQETVNAGAYCTAEQDGLSIEWQGRVWMNPPYAAGLIDLFIGKLLTHFYQLDVKQAVVLVNNGTETRWGQQLLTAASAVCFPASRIRFLDVNGNPVNSPLQGQMFAYLGDNTHGFTREFEQYGVILRG